ncbi:MAG: hypothetical protein CMJ83_01225 [Planctomycetes bacterium]|nr:hypothetical protein [Planctomycetota bacterium]
MGGARVLAPRGRSSINRRRIGIEAGHGYGRDGVAQTGHQVFVAGEVDDLEVLSDLGEGGQGRGLALLVDVDEDVVHDEG